MNEAELQQQIVEARKTMLVLKEATPWMFADYHELQQARREYAKAKSRLDAAKERWDRFPGEGR